MIKIRGTVYCDGPGCKEHSGCLLESLGPSGVSDYLFHMTELYPGWTQYRYHSPSRRSTEHYCPNCSKPREASIK